MRWWHVAVVIVVGLAACGRVGFDSAQQLQPPHGGGETGSI